jgi:hypothetical protein
MFVTRMGLLKQTISISWAAASNSSTLGSSWRTDSGSSSSQVESDGVQCVTQSSGNGENGCWNTYTASSLNTDYYTITAQLKAPSGSLASNNYTGIYCAAPLSTWGSTSYVCCFCISTGSGSFILSAEGPPAAPYICHGQTGQTEQSTAATAVSDTTTIALTRAGNVFTSYVGGSSTLTWTDTGGLIPTGVGFRQFGLITEGNYPTFQNAYASPAIVSITAQDN